MRRSPVQIRSGAFLFSSIKLSSFGQFYIFYYHLLLNHLYLGNIVDLTGQPGDVLSPVPSLAERGDYYEYI